MKISRGVAICLLCHGAVPHYARAAEQPNIVVIMADDMGFSDVGAFGSEIHTPNIDALAARGIRFRQFYTNTVCCPTRASLLTGLYPHRAGMGCNVHHGKDDRPRGPYQGYLNNHSVTIAEVLHEGGYETLMVGKWHVGEERPHWPIDRGFDHYYGLISGASNMFDIRKTMLQGMAPRVMAFDDQSIIPTEDGFYMTDAITDKAITFLTEGDSENPYFLYVAYTAPHYPLHVPTEEIDKYRGQYMIGWDQLRAQRLERQRQIGVISDDVLAANRDPLVPDWDDEQDKSLRDLKMAIYAGMITRMDADVGRLLNAIHRRGNADNTLILFLSDNGASSAESDSFTDRQEYNVPPYLGGEDSYDSYGRAWARVSTAPFRGYKGSHYEGGIASPMIAVWPRVITEHGGFSDEVGHVIDLMATFVDIAGVDYPQQYKGQEIPAMEGVSLVPAFRGEPVDRSGPLFWEYRGERAERDGRWKLVATMDGDWELYDLVTDRAERNNLATEMPQRVSDMVSVYDEWAQRCGVRPWNEVKDLMVNIEQAPSETGHR